MSSLTNNNPHWIYVDDGSGNLRGLAPGQTVDASGDYEKNLKGTANVAAPTKEQQAAADQAQAESNSATHDEHLVSPLIEANRIASQAHSAPLQQVIGDDDAPIGPPSGTVTTKMALIRDSVPGDPVRNAFGDHERAPEELGENASEVEVEQAERKHAASELLESVHEAAASGERAPEAGQGRGDTLREAPSQRSQGRDVKPPKQESKDE